MFCEYENCPYRDICKDLDKDKCYVLNEDRE